MKKTLLTKKLKYNININAVPPLIYFPPKIHKLNIRIRPITSCMGSPTYKMTKYLTSIITKIT